MAHAPDAPGWCSCQLMRTPLKLHRMSPPPPRAPASLTHVAVDARACPLCAGTLFLVAGAESGLPSLSSACRAPVNPSIAAAPHSRGQSHSGNGRGELARSKLPCRYLSPHAGLNFAQPFRLMRPPPSPSPPPHHRSRIPKTSAGFAWTTTSHEPWCSHARAHARCTPSAWRGGSYSRPGGQKRPSAGERCSAM